MKTLGFRDASVAAMMLGEAQLLCVGAAALGLLAASGILASMGRASGGDIPPVSLRGVVILYGVTAAAAIALASALPAAWRARRITIVSALASG